jgi:hypothetical protein
VVAVWGDDEWAELARGSISDLLAHWGEFQKRLHKAESVYVDLLGEPESQRPWEDVEVKGGIL